MVVIPREADNSVSSKPIMANCSGMSRFWRRADETTEPVDETKASLGNRIFEVISRSFSPLLGALAGAGMLKALLTVLTMVGWLSTESGTYFILSAAGNAVFYFQKIIHKDLHLFMLPLLSLIIIVPLTVLIFGPFGIYVGDAIGAAIGFLSSKSGILTGTVMGAGWTFLTLFGLHWGVVPIMISNIGSGGDPLTGMLAAAPFAQMGVALGIFLKAKDKNLKTLGGSTLLPGLLSGVTEPRAYMLLVWRQLLSVQLFLRSFWDMKIEDADFGEESLRRRDTIYSVTVEPLR
ncbi:hypothetical protein FLT43_07665 [Paenibacillus thiaminolyticus]|uniref:PTS EIIC type-1 domain-containing protein n=2 Tax=Paenibacillus thiaminolyticus TaxID=49283 RepID=A0AAP9DSK7_PANTH|nr:hypothetical protein FLT43_07665 [Paenibacillus thiaminolyticus]